MTHITPAQLTAWREMAEKATAGPWEGRATTFWGGRNNYMSVVSRLYSIAKMTGSENNLEFARIDAAFIAAAREAVPALLAEVERLRDETRRADEWERLAYVYKHERDAALSDRASLNSVWAVALLAAKHSGTWRDKPESHWLYSLMEEMLELALSVEGKHEHTPDVELEQIAAIAMNWLEMRGTQNNTIGRTLLFERDALREAAQLAREALKGAPQPMGRCGWCSAISPHHRSGCARQLALAALAAALGDQLVVKPG